MGPNIQIGTAGRQQVKGFDIKHRVVGAIMLIVPWFLLLVCALGWF